MSQGVLRGNVVLVLVLLQCACGGGGGGAAGGSNTVPAVTSVSVSCTPAVIQKQGTSQCIATLRGTGAFDSTVDWTADGGTIGATGFFTGPESPATVTITATSATNPGVSGKAEVVIADGRALADQANDGAGYQVHVMYVVASDGVDRELDTNGTITLSVEAWSDWFAGRTGGRDIRLDRINGALDITFARLGRSNAQMNAYGVQIRDQMEAELVAKGFDAPNKAYLVYYDGGDVQTGSCGAGAFPPSLPGTVGALFLNAVPASGRPCNENPFVTNAGSPGYVEFVGLHETLHMLGFVPTCAPNQTSAGHVADSNTDIMFAGSLAWNPTAVDFNGDDYFEAGLTGCIDLANSAFLDPLPLSAEPPPGWPYETLRPISCDQEGSLRSTAGNATTVQFVNGMDTSIDVYWLDFSGTRQFRKTLQPFEGFLESTSTTHPFVVTDETNQCLGIFVGTASTGRAIVGPM